ncbi:zinc finger protein OZF-like isoform X2 [Manduca sexta]|uniref:zinc finger protein OZF-like isoform X2 n=1 Tax=Manduca sexta TaxID=7130 RepID=UPI00188EF719|nr:zinc finger protein OZF-like isoform X2 [Manduca sexta]
MAQFLELSLDEYNAGEVTNQAVCVCCLAQDMPLIHLATCKHSSFLEYYFKFKMAFQTSAVCYQCHALLIKIDRFIQRVQDSFVVLNEKALQYKPVHNLQRTQVEVLSVDTSVDNGLKIEPTTSKEDQEYSIKDEFNVLDVGPKDKEFKLEKKEKLSPLKREKKDIEESYVNKLLVTILSGEEMEKEREKQRTEDKYLKRPFKCEKCIVAFDHEINLRSHVEQKHKQTCGGFVCKICESVYDSDVSLKAHNKRHYTRFKCKECDKQYLDERSAVLHYREKHTKGLQLYKCQVEDCGFETHTVHNKSSVFKCEKCDKQYKQRSGLSVHMQSAHSGDCTAYCDKCRRHFRTEQTLARHLRHHSSHVDKKYMCDECGARFVTKGNLKYHIEWAHLKMANYKCIQCSKVLRTSRSLRRHIEFVHENKQLPRDKICDYCGKGFTSASYLRTHVRSHTGERPHGCARCGAAFAHRAALYTHRKRHATTVIG